jgi:hypothetical protein
MATKPSSTDRSAYLTLGFIGAIAVISAIVLVSLLLTKVPTTHAHYAPVPPQLTLTIVAQGPNSSVQGPAYMPSTNLVLPAQALVTITIVNQDLGDTPLPAGSPFRQVTGTTGGVAYVDGHAYRALNVSQVAHTFTIPQLGVNVPIPGDVPAGQKGVTVTFSFRTGNAGTYLWRCMDPCGSGLSGWDGPMAMPGYMQGTLTLE